MGERIDPRLMDRRRRVAEDRARGNLGRLLRFLTVAAFIAVVVWLLQSPFLSVDRIEVIGAARVDVREVLAERDVRPGRPMVLLDIDGSVAALEAEPWIHDATVARRWPTDVVVEVSEHLPVAVVTFADGAYLVAADGTVLEPAEGGESLPTAHLAGIESADAGDDLEVEGAVEFLAALPEGRRAGSRVSAGEAGMTATVSGFEIRLGRPFDMADKAMVTAEVLDTGLEEGSVVTVVAPASPAVLPPGGGGTADGETTDTTGDTAPDDTDAEG